MKRRRSLSRFTWRSRRLFFRTWKRTALTVAGSLVLICAIVIGLAYLYVTHGGMTARRKAPSIEAYLAGKLVNWGIPAEARQLRNPLNARPDSSDVAAGRELYQRNCEICHGYDGFGKTEAGGGLYPSPANLRSEKTSGRTAGELFYLIRNGVRNTGMPGWQFADQQTWQLVSYIRNFPPVASTPPMESPHRTEAHFVGSTACAQCHKDVYDRWKATLMANVVRDPKVHPDAIIPDLSKKNPLVTFTIDDIAFVYGSKWKQRYFKKIGDDYYPLPAQWDVTHKMWKPYFAKEDWWAAHYPPDNFKRPTGSTCDGCHSVNYDVMSRSVTEWNVGCERCHGPGSEHIKNPMASNIVNPTRLDYVDGNDVCIGCHSQGRPLTNPIEGRYYDWAVGYHVGKKLSNYWKLEDHKLGQTTFTHFPDGTAHKNRMQGNDFVTSLMYTHGVSCFTCHDAHGTDNPSLLRKPANELCLDCHAPNSPNGPHDPTLEAHTHHPAGTPGSECIECHMPKIEQTMGDVNVRSHTFRFVYPEMTDRLGVPNACTVCHKDKSTAWASEALKSWTDRSPWREAN